VQTAELAQDVAAVDAILNSVAPFARGDVEHGNDWSARLPVDATWDDVNKLAPKTILCRPPSEYRMQAEKLEAAIKTANDTSAIFPMPAFAGFALAQQTAADLRLTYAQGLFISIFEPPCTDEQAKNRKKEVHNIEKLLKTPLYGALTLAAFPQALQSRAATAKELQ
jgi:hypothetical protein